MILSSSRPSPEEINALPLMEFRGKINLIATAAEAKKAVSELSKYKVLGFDTETKPSFKKGEFYHVALLQLATKDRAYLFHLCRAPMLSEVVSLLSSPDILKVGVATRDDIKGLQLLHPFEAQGFIDIALELAEPGHTPGLRTLVAQYLGLKLSKAAKITNWESPKLTFAQLNYAAKDAVAGLLIYEKLKEEILNNGPYEI